MTSDGVSDVLVERHVGATSLGHAFGSRPPVSRLHPPPEAISGEVNVLLLSQPDVTPRNALTVACFHTDISWMRSKVRTAPIRGATKIQPIHFVVPNRNGLVLLVQMKKLHADVATDCQQNKAQSRACIVQNRRNSPSCCQFSMQTGGVPGSPLPGLSEYTPPPPLNQQKPGNHVSDPKKRSMFMGLPSAPRDISVGEGLWIGHNWYPAPLLLDRTLALGATYSLHNTACALLPHPAPLFMAHRVSAISNRVSVVVGMSLFALKFHDTDPWPKPCRNPTCA